MKFIFHLTRTKNHLKTSLQLCPNSILRIQKTVHEIQPVEFFQFSIKLSHFNWPEKSPEKVLQKIALTCRILRGYEICHTNLTTTNYNVAYASKFNVQPFQLFIYHKNRSFHLCFVPCTILTIVHVVMFLNSIFYLVSNYRIHKAIRF